MADANKIIDLDSLLRWCVRSPSGAFAYSECKICHQTWWDNREMHLSTCLLPAARDAFRDLVAVAAVPPYGVGVCSYCGLMIPYKDEADRERARQELHAHDESCPKNPLVARLSRRCAWKVDADDPGLYSTGCGSEWYSVGRSMRADGLRQRRVVRVIPTRTILRGPGIPVPIFASSRITMMRGGCWCYFSKP